MPENKNLLAICTHYISKGIISEYKKMSNIEGYDCILVINNSQAKIKTNNTSEPIVTLDFYNTPVKCFLYDLNMNNSMNLPNNFKERKENVSFYLSMWHNADYRFYYIKKYLPDYEYYWQFDYDIFCNGKSYKPFLDKYANKNEDVLICRFREETFNSSWSWTHNVEWLYEQSKTTLYGSFFPISRLSNRAVDFLYKKRLEHDKKFKEFPADENKQWPFSELFVPTELLNNGYTGAAIDEPNIGLNEFDLNEDRFFEEPNNLLYHPVKGNFIEKLRTCRVENKNLREKIVTLQNELNALKGVEGNG